MLPPQDLHVDVLVVVFMQGGGGVGVSEPEIDSVGGLLKGNACEWDTGGYVGEQCAVLVAEIVVLSLGVTRWGGGGVLFLCLNGTKNRGEGLGGFVGFDE